jgi:hypothetical protein
MASIGNDEQVPLGLMGGLPVSDERARELAQIIASSMSKQEGVPALCELLLGVAPMNNFSDLIETSKQRVSRKALIFAPSEVEGLLADIWQRFSAASCAVETMYTYTPEFMRAMEEYAYSLRRSPDAPEGGKA